ncbi:MAG TPA: TonB-dependent receptor [Vicinamibacterales bacterium]|nr:TonB-dependent receptor [Vicinamibacterales bacterium]
MECTLRRAVNGRVALSVALSALLTASMAFAQGGATTATLAGKIVDDTGGRLPGASITLIHTGTNQSRSVVSNEEGLYRFAGLPPGTYALSAELQGFAPARRTGITLNVGAAVDLDVTMRISSLQESVTVSGEAAVVESAKTSLSTVITKEQIDALPTRSRNYLDFALLTPGTVENVSTNQQGIGLNMAGARAKEASLIVDGIWNTDESFTFPRQKYSQDAIAEFQVVGLGGTAEFGRAIGGIVSAVTRSGANALSGSGYGYFRDTRLNAEDPLSKQRGIPKPKFNRQLFGASIGGPLVKNRTFYFGAAERTQQNQPQDNNITASTGAVLGLPPADVGAVTATLRDTFWMTKVNHRLSDANSMYAAFAYTRDKDFTTPASFATRSKRQRLTSTDVSYQFGWTGIARGGTWLHEARASYFPRDYTLDNPDFGGPPLAPEGQLRASVKPTVSITNTATFGGGTVTLAMHTKPVQAVYSLTMSKKTHAVKFGVDGMFVDFVYIRFTGPQTASYNFSSLDNYLRGVYSTYSELFGEPELDRFHTYVSAYAQDSWAATNRLTINYGLRYDVEHLSKYQGLSYGSDRNNVGPRLGLSYDLTGRGKTVFKASTGMYYDRIFQNPITPTFFQAKSVLQQVSGVWSFGQPGAPVFPNTLPNLAPSNVPAGVRDVYIPPDVMQVPMSYQAIATIDHALQNDLAASASVLYTRSTHKELLFDRNLTFNDALGRFNSTRPDPSFRRILQYSYSGKAEYVGLVLEARKRVSGRFFFSGNATVARAYDQGDNFSSQVEDPRHPEAEYAPGVDTPRFRITANGSYEINRALTVSAVVRARTGFAYTARGGNTVDFNGDGNFNDRVPGTSRNQFRMPGNHSLDLRLSYSIPLRGDHKIQLTADAFNVYNHDNVATVNGTWGPNIAAPIVTFGAPLTYFNPREIQLALRYAF